MSNSLGNIWFWSDSNTPIIVKPKAKFVGVAIGKNKTYGLTNDGKVWSWINSDPTRVHELKANSGGWFSSEKVIQISANDDNFACVTDSGKAYTMGRGNFGQLGNGKVKFCLW